MVMVFFDVVLNSKQKNFPNILQRKINILQREYFSSVSKGFVGAGMHYLYDDAVADHFDDVCHRLSVKKYYYDEEISGFILSQENGAMSIWFPFSMDDYIVDDILNIISNKLENNTPSSAYSISQIESNRRYWCLTIENVVDKQHIKKIFFRIFFSTSLITNFCLGNWSTKDVCTPNSELQVISPLNFFIMFLQNARPMPELFPRRFVVK